MPTFENPAADAEEVAAALRGLAHATRAIDDPPRSTRCSVRLAWACGAEQALHQLGRSTMAARERAWMSGDAKARVGVVQGGLGAASSGRDGSSGRAGLDERTRGRGDDRVPARFPALPANDASTLINGLSVSGRQDGRLHSQSWSRPAGSADGIAGPQAAARSLMIEDRERRRAAARAKASGTHGRATSHRRLPRVR